MEWLGLARGRTVGVWVGALCLAAAAIGCGEDEMVEHDNLSHVLEQLQTMDQREATVLKMRFGLEDHEPRTLKEIGEALGLTRERVRQIETEALAKLAESLEGTN